MPAPSPGTSSSPPSTELRLASDGERSPAVRGDLHSFLDGGRPFEERAEPARTVGLARQLHDALAEHTVADSGSSVEQRIVTDGVLRGECDRDQNVYLGKVFTRTLTRSVPDLLFLPANAGELASALRWSRDTNVPVTLRGAASTAMGGAVPGDGGLAIDLAKLDRIELDRANNRVRIGTGTRMRPLHRALREAGLALPVYPSNLGGTFAGWFATGGIGMNAYGRGRAADAVLAAEIVLPDGARWRLDALGGAQEHVAGAWQDRGSAPVALADLAGSEGQFGALVELELAVEPLPELCGFLLAFEAREEAFEAVEWIGRTFAADETKPADVKLLSGSHLHHVRAVWREEDGKAWQARKSADARDADLPWSHAAGPEEFGVATSDEHGHAGAYLFVDFLDRAGAQRFADALADCPGAPQVLAESRRFALDRFRPQQVKRLGPGFLAAEILLPASQVQAYQPRAERLADNAGTELDLEVYYLSDGSALAIAGYLTDHRQGSFPVDLLLAPALLDLAIASAQAKPYVLGRWQANLLRHKLGATENARLRRLKDQLDPEHVVNRGAFFAMGLRTPLGKMLELTMGPAVRVLRTLVGLAPPIAGLARRLMRGLPGPAAGRGDAISDQVLDADVAPHGSLATGRAIHCVNCGECNSVCPIFHESHVRLPQMLTHLGEELHGGGGVAESGSTLLDLCMRCGNCEEVCQAGIPHLPLYSAMQAAAERERPRERERHVAILEQLRGSPRYTRDFLDVRPGGYLQRTPAALPGEARFRLLRAEGEAGPSETCIHCAACVDVCPTNANREYEADDPRLITTVQESCIGCGTCVEVCPANQLNGGRTLRVMEAPTLDWFTAVDEFLQREGALS